jgi:hypothetical protein
VTPAAVFGAGALAGGLLVLSLRHVRRAAERRYLASVFVGEIVAILRGIEIEDVVARMAQASPPGSAPRSMSALTLPRFVIYEAHAARLCGLPPSLSRKISHVYTRLAMLQHDSTALASSAGLPETADNRAGRTATLLHDLEETLDVADEVLRELRPLLPVRHAGRRERHLIAEPDARGHERRPGTRWSPTPHRL